MRVSVRTSLDAAERVEVAQWVSRTSLEVVSVDPDATPPGAELFLVVASQSDTPDARAVRAQAARAAERGLALVVVSVRGCRGFDDLDATAQLRLGSLTAAGLAGLEPALSAFIGPIVEAAPGSAPTEPQSSEPVVEGLVVVNEENAADGTDATLASSASASHVRQTRVFLSYRRPDESAMNRVRAALEERGYRVWWDKDKASIPAGTFWPSSVEQGIAESDAFIVLLSPNSLKSPKQIQRELYLADQAGKRMVALMVRPIDEWPDGFNYFLGGLERISLNRDFAGALDELSHFLGPTSVAVETASGLLGRLGRGRDRFRRFARDKDLASRVKTHGATALATAGAVAVAVAAAQAKQKAEAKQRYIEETSQLLNKSLKEIKFAKDMSPKEYRNDFQPRYQRLMGQLESSSPPPALVTRHQRLVRDLDALGEEFDELMRLAESGDLSGLATRVERLNGAWADVVTSNISWLKSALGVAE